VLLAALATHTSHIGLVLTAPALYGDPATLAREIASLDHVSRGRGAWNIITSQHEHSRKILGADSELARSARRAGWRLHQPSPGVHFQQCEFSPSRRARLPALQAHSASASGAAGNERCPWALYA
jgi:hypothetical protein